MMVNMEKTQYKNLKLNDCFQFDSTGDVFVRCRGGFRSGRGGELHKTFPSHTVIRYFSDWAIKTEKELQNV